MGIVAASPAQDHPRKISPIWPAIGGLLYALMVALAAWRHEPWADEAQSWLLARDAGLVELWTRLLHYEGTPGLWQTVLHFAILLGVPYSSLNLISVSCGLAACYLLLRRAPFPIAVRLALPFTFFLAYQYSVVARSYCLLPPLLFAAASIYRKGASHSAALTIVLGLMAAVSVHGMALSCSIWVAYHGELLGQWRKLRVPDRRTVLLAGGCYWLAVLLLGLAAWPASDNMFVRSPNWSLEHLAEVTGKAVLSGFAGGWILSLAAIGLSLPLLWRGRALPLFLLSLCSLSLLNGFVYSQVWHYGLLFLGWLFAMWIAAGRVQLRWPALGALGIVICVQCYWTAEAIGYDWNNAYSASRDAAAYLKSSGIARQRLFAIGYACVGIEPYFGDNIFANIRGGKNPSYWDWSVRNHVNEDSERLTSLRPDYVIVGYKGAYEKDLWTKQIRESGYRLLRHFEGNTFWEAAILEPESFDLYQRPAS